MTLSWDELASHGLMKKIPEREVVTLIMRYLRPMRRKWVKDHGSGEVEKYIMDNGHHGARKLFESPDISKEMWCKAALRKEFKSQWWWRAPEKRREKCGDHVLQTTGDWPERIMGMPDELLKNDVHGVYEQLGDGWVEGRTWAEAWYPGRSSIKGIPKTYTLKRSLWYRNIHEGRYFLFFRMNERLKEKEKRSPGYIEDHFHPDLFRAQWDYKIGPSECDFWNWHVTGKYQCASDLLTIDGYGLNHSPGKEVKHIDEMFP